MDSNPQVLDERDFERRYVTEGVNALDVGNIARARSCIEKLVYIKHCLGIHISEIKKYFDSLRQEKTKLLQAFDSDFTRYYNICQENLELRLRQRERATLSTTPAHDQKLDGLVNQAAGLKINPSVSNTKDRHGPDPAPKYDDDDDDDSDDDRKGSEKRYEPKDSRTRHGKEPDPKSGDLASEISKPSFQGTRGEEERLDPRYFRRNPREAGALLKVGRVFAILRHSEYSGDGGLGQVKWKQTTKLGVEIFSHICRMVVVKECHGFVWAIPINTYSGHGVGKRGFNQADIDAHAIIYMQPERPRAIAREPSMRKTPIKVIPVGGETLDAASRINFSKPHSIDHNVKFLNIGKVAQESMPYLSTYWKQYL